MQEKKNKKENGITLVSLVITIIVLLILAGISINTITDQNAITQKSSEARNSAEIKSEMQMVEVASNSSRGGNRYGNISIETLQRELDISAGKNKTKVSEFDVSSEDDNAIEIENEDEIDNLSNVDKIGFKITFLNSKRVYFIYNEGEEAEILFLGVEGKNNNYGVIHAVPRRGIIKRNTNANIKVLLRTFLTVSKENVTMSYGWSKSNYKEPSLYTDVLQSEIEGDEYNKRFTVSYPNEKGIYYLYVKAKIDDGEEIPKQFGQYEIVDESATTVATQYTIYYRKGNNVSRIGANYDTTRTGKVILPSINAERGCKAIGWFDEDDRHIGNAGEEISVNRNVTLTAKATDSSAPTVKIAKVDYNTFNWEAIDNGEIKGYQILRNPSTEPSANGTGWITDGDLYKGTYDNISDAGTYYVYVKDNEGNIGKKSIGAYLMTRTEGEGTSLTTKVDGKEGTEVTQNTVVLQGTEIYAVATANNGYTIPILKNGSKMMNASGDKVTIYSNTTIESSASKQDENAPTVTIARTDYNTFNWTASDDGTIEGYLISTSSTIPLKSDNGWTTTGTVENGTYDISDAQTYYVYVKDTDGNIGSNSIDAYLLTRNQEENTVLNLRIDSSSSSTGIPITGNTPVLKETPIWASATATTGYSPVLKFEDTVKNASGDTAIVNSDITVSSTTKEHTYTIVFDKNGGTDGTMRNMTDIPYNEERTLTGNAFSKAGYRFNCWNTKADGTGTNYENKATISMLSSTDGDTITLYAMWVAKTINYKVNYYVHVVGDGTTGNEYRDTYILNSSETKTALTDSTVTLADLKKNITGYTYEGNDSATLGQGYITTPSAASGYTNEFTKPSSGAITTTTILPPSSASSNDSPTVINLFYRPNRLYVKYHVNGGTLAATHGEIMTLSDSYINYSIFGEISGDNTKELVGVYGSTVNQITNINTYGGNTGGLMNYNNSSYINIERTTQSGGKLMARGEEEWFFEKSANTYVYYDQDIKTYTATDFASRADYNLSTGDVTITLKVNWINPIYSVSNCSYGNPTKYTDTLKDANEMDTENTRTITVDPLELGSSYTDGTAFTNRTKTTTLNLNGNTLLRSGENVGLRIESGTLTVSGTGTLKTSSTGVEDLIYGTGGTFATSGTPVLFSTGRVYGINMNLNLNGGTIISTDGIAVDIHDWNTASITSTKILGCQGAVNALRARNLNPKSLTITDSIIANGSVQSTGYEDNTATTIIWVCPGTLTIQGNSRVNSGPYADNAIATPDNTFNGKTYSGEGSSINITGSTSIYANEWALATHCSKIYVNTSGIIASSNQPFAISNNSITADITIARGVLVMRDETNKTVYYTIHNNGTFSGPSLNSYPGSTRIWPYYKNSGTQIVSDSYSRSNTYAYFRGWYESSDGYWYYFKLDGTKKTDWLYLDGKWYYLVPTANWNGSTRPLGSRLQGGQFTINGKIYKFDADGVCTNPPN